jgi:uncharacterized phage protein (TIGR01671 family)
MREIKFRAWNKPTRQMIFWGFFTDIFDKGAADRRNFEPEHNEWMQFTGLKDKNGKEIYEGDIVHCEDEMYAGATELAKKFSTNESQLITFEHGAFRFDGITLGDMLGPGAHPLIFEVIGNIYENPSLLTSPDNQ